MEKIVIVGAGGFGREVEWLINRINLLSGKLYELAGYVDDNLKKGTKIGHSEVICNTNELMYSKARINVVIAIGNANVRRELANKLSVNDKLDFPNIIDPSVIYDNSEVSLGKGNIICAGTIMTTNITIGNFDIVNLDCTIGHDGELGDFITIYPSSNISGNVKMMNVIEVGTGSQIIQGKSITSDVIIGAGAVVVKDIIDSGTYVGVPVTKIK